MTITNSQLFNELCGHYGARPDRRGEVHVNCPACGKEVKHGQTHFSFSLRGGKCMVCGFQTTLYALRNQVGDHPTVERPIVPLPRKVVTPLQMTFGEYLEIYTGSEEVAKWQEYKPLTERQVKLYCLGYGIIPRSACHHPRLTVPVLDKNGHLLHIRGRHAGCTCETKWTVSGGWTMDHLEPYNYTATERSHSIILILENPIDAIMVSDPVNRIPILGLITPQLNGGAAHKVNRYLKVDSRYPIAAIATLSVSYWRDSWVDYLTGADQVIVLYDNDLPGNGGAKNRDEFIKLWREGNENRPIPKANGIELANKLLHQHIPATLFDWVMC